VKAEELKTAASVAEELSESYADVIEALHVTTATAKTTKKLWRTSNRSMLIKVGVALIAFPDPTISDVLGAMFIAVGTVQQGIRKRTLYIDDTFKTFQKTFNEVRSLKDGV